MDERELVRRAKGGDEVAFEALVRRCWAKAYRLAESLVGSADAEDVVVEAFVQAWQALPRFREQASFGTWLFRIVLNQARQWRRKQATVPVEPIEAESEEGEELSLRDIEALACEQDWRHRVQQAVQQLPEHLRLPLVLRFWDELSYPEIAELLGIKESTARMRVASALKHLAILLAKMGALP
jgi:RNA polymerase sigma-70 factor (ECF subfamily)